VIRAIAGGHGVKQRLGHWKFKPDNRKTVWFHAASMGELKVISCILPELLKNTSDLRIIITTITKTGKTKAEKLFDPIEVYYLPLDLKWCVNRVLKTVKPSMLVLVETELWPVLIRQASRMNVKIVTVNARISYKSFRLYKLTKALFTSALRNIELIIAQTDNDAARFIKLGASAEQVATYGNIKFDQVLDKNLKEPSKEIKDFLNHDDRFVFIAGSIRTGEFQDVLQAITKALKSNIEIRTVIAPRHMKDIGVLETCLKSFSLGYVKRSELPAVSSKVSVMILDTMGELSGLYSYANLAFVGGSLVNIGGHDPLEPASAGCTVCFGPHMDNSLMFANLLVDSEGATYINNSDELLNLIIKLAGDKNLCSRLGKKAYQVVLDNAGVSAKTARKLSELI
jgi:3-deoxy-D-manno-octulosonic-acid transferase